MSHVLSSVYRDRSGVPMWRWSEIERGQMVKCLEYGYKNWFFFRLDLCFFLLSTISFEDPYTLFGISPFNRPHTHVPHRFNPLTVILDLSKMFLSALKSWAVVLIGLR